MKDRDDKKKAGGGAVAGAAVGGVATGVTTGALAGGITGPVGAAIGAAVGAVVGAVGGKSAAGKDTGKGSSHDDQSVHTVIGAFDDTASAQRAVERLAQAGFQRDDIHLEHRQGSGVQPAQQRAAGMQDPNDGFFTSLYGVDGAGGMQQSRYAEHAYTYDEAVRRGSAVVVVDAHGEQRADEACSLLHELGAVDVDERAKQWRADGWAPPTGMQQNMTADQRGDLGSDQDGKLDVVEEQLQVGKRTLDRGGVRVVQRVSSKPVRELVRLREEHAVVERHAVDRPATGQDLSNFKEGTLEVRETVEEPVVAKTARVVEEVRVGKEVRERDETIEDTVRRKDVEVERFAGQGGRSTERERAVAADESLTGTRKPGDKDKPTM